MFLALRYVVEVVHAAIGLVTSRTFNSFSMCVNCIPAYKFRIRGGLTGEMLNHVDTGQINLIINLLDLNQPLFCPIVKLIRSELVKLSIELPDVVK